jgi:hypothetical protein
LTSFFSAFASPQAALGAPAQHAFFALDLDTDFTSGMTAAVEAVDAVPALLAQHDALLLAHAAFSAVAGAFCAFTAKENAAKAAMRIIFFMYTSLYFS